jgi:hypothetical protein
LEGVAPENFVAEGVEAKDPATLFEHALGIAVDCAVR